jgi:hypothetical protein
MTPGHVAKAVRRLLWPAVLAAGLVALGGLDPWVEGVAGGALALKAASFYGATLLLYAAFPRQRRSDLTVVALVWVVALDLAVGLIGTPRSPGWVALDAASAVCAYLPGRLEVLRRQMRRTPDQSFRQLADADRRRRRVRHGAPARTTARPARTAAV